MFSPFMVESYNASSPEIVDCCKSVEQGSSHVSIREAYFSTIYHQYSPNFIGGVFIVLLGILGTLCCCGIRFFVMARGK